MSVDRPATVNPHPSNGASWAMRDRLGADWTGGTPLATRSRLMSASIRSSNGVVAEAGRAVSHPPAQANTMARVSECRTVLHRRGLVLIGGKLRAPRSARFYGADGA